MKLYFTPAGADRFRERLLSVEKELQKVQAQKGPAVDRGTWHDNAEFEDLVRKEHMLTHRVADLREKFARMVVVGRVSTDTTRLRIGHIAEISVDGEEPIAMEIGGYEDTDSATSPPVVSYLAPLISRLMGEPVGTEVFVDTETGSRRIVLLAIELKGGVE